MKDVRNVCLNISYYSLIQQNIFVIYDVQMSVTPASLILLKCTRMKFIYTRITRLLDETGYLVTPTNIVFYFIFISLRNEYVIFMKFRKITAFSTGRHNLMTIKFWHNECRTFWSE